MSKMERRPGGLSTLCTDDDADALGAQAEWIGLERGGFCDLSAV
jgi:hypothetical protein